MNKLTLVKPVTFFTVPEGNKIGKAQTYHVHASNYFGSLQPITEDELARDVRRVIIGDVYSSQIRFAIENAVRVINNSLGDDLLSEHFTKSIDYQGIDYFMIAGREGLRNLAVLISSNLFNQACSTLYYRSEPYTIDDLTSACAAFTVVLTDSFMKIADMTENQLIPSGM